jgi:hypothetical protein
MATLYGRTFTRHELLSYTDNMAQFGGIRPLELVAGRERGVRGFDVATGSGLEFTVLADRALDITRANFRGRSLAYHAPGGQAHPAYYEAQGLGWLKNFAGGLLTTCGLRALGSPSSDNGEEFGLHGRISNLPAEEIGYWQQWQDDEYWMHIHGTMTEGVQFGSSLRLTRHLSARLGGNSLHIEDSVENLGGLPSPHMMLYHCNLGFPLLAPSAELFANSRRVTPRDADAAAGLTQWSTFEAPTPGYREQVFYHEMEADNDGEVRVALINRALDGGLGVYLKYHQKTLPHLVQWKQLGYGTYVLGIEPANCHVEGIAAERASGRLQILQPSETRHYRLELGVLDGLEEIEAFMRTASY